MADSVGASGASRRGSGAERRVDFPEVRQGGAGMQPERRLMVSVLRDGLNTFRKYATASEASGRRRFREVERWLAADDFAWPFSFANICEELGLDAAGMRGRLWRWRAMQERLAPTPYAWLLRLKPPRRP